MSKRTFEADRAIRKAWEREYELVLQGKGTRDWTEEQQKDILDPYKGKAYDDSGRAYQGQHMKSASEYPQYQGDPGNIQFLTKDEHLEAHKGSWQNPTNWYYNPQTKEFIDFGEGVYIPCPIIELSQPIHITTDKSSDDNDSSWLSDSKPASVGYVSDKSSRKKRLWDCIVAAGEYLEEHPEIESTLNAVGTVSSCVESSLMKDNHCASFGDSPSVENVDKSESDPLPAENQETIGRQYPEERATPGPNDVSPHIRHMNGKTIHVRGYHRGSAE